MSPSEVELLKPRLRETWAAAGSRCAAGTTATAEAMTPGCQAGRALLHALTFAYEDPVASGPFLDAGAHVGRWAAEVLSTFGRLEYRKYAKEFGHLGASCPSPTSPSLTIVCLEPVQANFERLRDRAKRSGWQLEDVQVMRAGLSNVSGKAQIFVDGTLVDPSASLSAQEGRAAVVEKMTTVDALLKKSVAQGKAFLLHLATNGHEHAALLGAKKSLKKRLLSFVVLEVSQQLWSSAGYQLSDAVALLWKNGRFVCFALLPEPVPLSGPFWPGGKALSQGPDSFLVLCGGQDDAGLRRVLRVLDPEAPDYLLGASAASAVASLDASADAATA